MEPPISGLALLGVLILASGYFALARAALANCHRVKLRQLAEDGVRGARWAERVAEQSVRFLITVQFGQTLTRLLAAAVASITFAPLLSDLITQFGMPTGVAASIALLVVVAVLAIILLLVGEKIPEALAMRNPEGIALALAWSVHLFSAVFAPVVRLAMRIGQGIVGTKDLETNGLAFVTEQEIKTLVDAGQEEGVIEEDEKAMIYSIFRFGDTAAREVMVPRIDIVALEITSSLGEALKVIVDAGHSRIPVYRDHIDNVQGILYAKDLLTFLLPDGEGWGSTSAEFGSQSLEGLLRPAYFVPESKMLDDLLADLQLRKVHMAIIVDEYGGTAGVVTIEDILEEIVGEIQDEYDTEEALFQVVGEDDYIFNARIDVDDVNEMLGTSLPTEQGDTLGGLIYSQLGKVPAAGEIIEHDGFSIEVMGVVSRRIKNVRVRRQRDATDEATGGIQSSIA